MCLFWVINTSNCFLNGIKLHNSVTPWKWIWNISKLICFLALNAKIMKNVWSFHSIFHTKWLMVPTKKTTSLILYIACWMYFSPWRKMQTKSTIKTGTELANWNWAWQKMTIKWLMSQKQVNFTLNSGFTTIFCIIKVDIVSQKYSLAINQHNSVTQRL